MPRPSVGSLLPSLFLSAAILGLAASPAAAAPFIRGDATGDLRIDLADPVRVLDVIFLGDAPPVCQDAEDANDDGGVDLTDAIYLLAWLFQGGKEPPPPFFVDAGRAVELGFDETPDPFPCGDFPAETGSLTQEEVFDRLTAATWYDPTIFIPASRALLADSFGRDGTWVEVLSLAGGDGEKTEGQWDFRRSTRAGGQIILTSGDVRRFALLADGGLSLGGRYLVPCPRDLCGDGLPACPECTADDRPRMEMSPDAVRLTAHAWRKAHDFDSFKPEVLQVSGDGAMTAVYRSGACSATGLWSLVDHQLLFERASPPCASIGFPWSISFEGDDLDLGGNLYTPAATPADVGTYLVTVQVPFAYGTSELRLTYDRPLAAGINRFHYELRARDALPAFTVRFSRTPVVFTGPWYQPAGETVPLGAVEFPALAGGKIHAGDLEMYLGLVPGSEMEIDLTVEGAGGDAPQLFPRWIFAGP